jgi:adenylate cyclase
MSDTHSPELVIETLNRYFDCIIPPVQRRGGEVVEIMGDAMLVIFNENSDRNSQDVCRRALEAAKEGLAALERSNVTQAAIGGPDCVILHAGFALHHGQASYGNIGAGDRLDFTIIGPDVNLTSRIERICRIIGRELIMSANFAGLLDEPTFAIGHFDLRGFARKQLLFGLD